MVVYVGPRCHFVPYPLRGGAMFNQVAIFESARAKAGENDWGTPDELDAAFAHTTENEQKGLPLDRALVACQAVRGEHCRRVVTASRDWGALWQLDGEMREPRNEILRARGWLPQPITEAMSRYTHTTQGPVTPTVAARPTAQATTAQATTAQASTGAPSSSAPTGASLAPTQPVG